MSDEEYDDELPPICVNSSARETGILQMPSAEELASQRAREAECERELLALRAADLDPVLATADSSGSEGEAALAAAVTRLRVRAEQARRPRRALLAPALARLPHAEPLASLAADPAMRDAITDAMCSAALSNELSSVPGGASLCAAWLAGAAGAGPRGRRRRARRALHRLLAAPPLDDPDTEDSRTLKAALLEGVAAGAEAGAGAEAALELADALAPAPSPAAAVLARRLLAAALADLLQTEPAPAECACLCAWASASVCAAWARLGGAGAAACVRACGRVARACPGAGLGEGAGAGCGAARARLLQALAAPPAARAHPDTLEVLVGASKLQLLFRE